MSQLPPVYVGDPFYYTGTYKPNGIPTEIDGDIEIKAYICTKCGELPITVTVDPDQSSNVGKFVISGQVSESWQQNCTLIIRIKVLGVSLPSARATFRVLGSGCECR